MRIIAGAAKGRRLKSPPGIGTRPLTGRAKEALFSSLGTLVVDADVLDLYAGSGSIGLEALSRGAASAVFVERDRRIADTLQANVDLVGLGGSVRRTDVEGFLRSCSSDYDLVFVDPPYAEDDAVVAAVLGAIAPVVRSHGVVVVHRRAGGAEPVVPEGLHLRDRRRYGEVELWRFGKEDP
ncbi:MAG: 16S rRNA (guanine(966)-N(2))-methyltransferase RsmD [Acidimicrobiia bacterium]|nr:16S rRNA (guanine(966)-N(2))-methyltransferase RsmD [Acidimicrobiia bacterium]